MDESRAAKDSHDVGSGTPTRTLIAERYRVLRVLGEGSSGIVYLCEHTALEKEVAVKVLHRELADNASLVARFTREAQTAARLDHPNSVHVMDFGQDRDGTLYLAMEYVEGADLAELLQHKLPLSDERIVHFMSCILSALSAAHSLGIVHRDLKPENVLVRVADPASAEPDVVKVCDFGVAQFSPVRLARTSGSRPISTMTRRVTGEGMMVGTPWYMSPEQARAETLDARSDIYSAGVVLFQLLTRTLPFLGDDVMAVALAHCTTPPPNPGGFCAVHPGLEAVCLKALSKTPELRYQTATEMLTALHEAVAIKTASRSLARVSRPTGTAITLAPISLRPERLATTPLATPSVRMPSTLRKLRPSFLIAGVATTLLGVAAVPRLLPSQHTVKSLSAAASRSARRFEQVIGVYTARQPPAASVGIQDDPTLLQPAAAAAVLAEPELLAVDPELLPASDVPAPQPPAAAQPAVTSKAAPVAAPSGAVAAPARPAEPKAAAVPAPATPSIPSAPAQAQSAKVVEPKVVAQPVSANMGSIESAEEDVPESPSEAAASAAQIALSTLPAAAPPAPAPVPKVEEAKPVARTPVKFARVDVNAERLPPGVPRGVLRGALNAASLLTCYTQAQQRSPQLELSGTALELKTNTSGRIVWAHVTNGALPQPLRDCLEQAARNGNVRTGEGGEVQATLSLLPSP